MSRPLPPIDWFCRACWLIAVPLIVLALFGLAFYLEQGNTRFTEQGRPIVETTHCWHGQVCAQ